MIKTLFTIYLLACAAGSQSAQRPDIMLILLDDAGYSDLGAFGSEIKTPNIDSLVTEGMRFTDCHAPAPNCSPSRAGLLTGRIPARAGMYSYIPPGHPMHLRSEETTIAELMQAEGYATGHFGKWHLSELGTKQPQPDAQGYDYWFATSNNAIPSHRNPNNFFRNGKPIGEQKGYACHLVVDECMKWLEKRKKTERVFTTVWFHEPHQRIASPPELIAEYRKRDPKLSKKQATYYANIHNVDLAMGRLLKKLKELGRAKNTLLFFSSDNGGVNPWSNGGFRGRKSLVYEGGHREPGILRWPGHAEAGSVCTTPVGLVDLLPTLCEATGIDQPTDRPSDGQSLIPLLKGDEFARETPLFWFFYRVAPAVAMRDGDWVLLGHLARPAKKFTHRLSPRDIPYLKTAAIERFELYNLRSDRKQEHDRKTAEPERFERMKAAMIELRADVVADSYEWSW